MKNYNFVTVSYHTPNSIDECNEYFANRYDNERDVEDMREKIAEATELIAEALGMKPDDVMLTLEESFHEDMISFVDEHPVLEDYEETKLIKDAELSLCGSIALDLFWQMLGEIQNVVPFSDLATNEEQISDGQLSCYETLEQQDAIEARLFALYDTVGVHDWLSRMAWACLEMLYFCSGDYKVFRDMEDPGMRVDDYDDLCEIKDRIDGAVEAFNGAIYNYRKMYE